MLDAKEVKANQTRMESARMGFDSLRGELASLILPHHAHFQGRYSNQGEDRGRSMFDEYGAMALEDGVAAFEGFVVPRGQQYLKLELHDEKLMKPLAHRQWLEKTANLILSLRADAKSGWSTSVNTSATMLLGLGQQGMWYDKRYDAYGRFAGLSYQSEHIDGIWIDRDAEGNVLRIHRKFTLTAEQAMRKWQERAPAKVHAAMTKAIPTPQESFDFLHVIERNPSVDPRRFDAAGMAWLACYFSVKDDAIFIHGGYRTLRRVTSCFARSSNEDYGRGRANLVLRTLRAMQVIMQDRILGVEQKVKPPLLAMDDDLDQGIVDLSPWGITYGGLDERGNATIRPFLENIDLADAEKLQQQFYAMLDKVFYRDLLQINRELKTHISAARTMEEIGEKGIMLAPLAKQEEEWFSPGLDCELDMVWDDGLLDDMPEGLRPYFESGAGIKTKYDNGVTRMREASEAAGYLRTGEQVAAIAAYDDTVIPAFKREFPMTKVLPNLARINGVPATWAASEDEKAEFDAKEQQKLQTEQLLALAPALSQTAKNLTSAGAGGGA